MWVTTKSAERASGHRQITKIRPSDANGRKTFRRRCYLGMVEADLEVIWGMSDQMSAERPQFPWRLNRSTISANLELI